LVAAVKWWPQFEDLVAIKRDAGGLSIVHSTGEVHNLPRAFAAALVVLVCVVYYGWDPLMLAVVVAAVPARRMESLRMTSSGFEFTNGPSFTREEFIRALPTGAGELTFEFHGGQTRTHFHRLSPIQAAQIVEGINRFLTPTQEPALPTPASSQR